MSKKLRILLGLGGAALLIMLLLVPALAQTNGTGTAGTNYNETFLDRLAGLLGTDRSRLDTAVKQAGNDVITQAENDGTISKERADWMRQRVDKGGWHGWGKGFMGPGRHGPFGHRGMKGIHGAGLDAAANALGITRDQLNAELRDGKTLGEIADARGVDRQKVKDALVADHKQKLDEAVKNGNLTQKQADLMLELFQTKDLLDKPMGCAWNKGTDSGGTTTTGSTATPSI